jgi:hypothetical protein
VARRKSVFLIGGGWSPRPTPTHVVNSKKIQVLRGLLLRKKNINISKPDSTLFWSKEQLHVLLTINQESTSLISKFLCHIPCSAHAVVRDD